MHAAYQRCRGYGYFGVAKSLHYTPFLNVDAYAAVRSGCSSSMWMSL